MKLYKLAAAAAVIAFSVNVNASVFNTLNSIKYEWLELTATQGVSRDQVNLRLSNPNDELYGYEYASRALVEDLLLSYTTWDGLDGLHGDPIVVAGLEQYINDFGALFTSSNFGPVTYTSVDGYEELIDEYVLTLGIFGADDECYNRSFPNPASCLSNVEVYYSSDGSPSLAYQQGTLGYDSESFSSVSHYNFIGDLNVGSYLVRVSPVPVPVAIWLFSSGLIGLIGIARRKKS